MSTNVVRRIKLVVSYDGTDFRGWSAQLGQRTVQGTLKDAVRRVTGEDVEIVGASRTDSGAHAEGQVCHLDSSVAMPIHKWVRALNDVLPNDLRIRSASHVGDDFNSRFMALDRTYEYQICTANESALVSRFAFGTPYALDVPLMNRSAKIFVGKHDFRAFTEELDPKIDNTVREVFSIKVARVGPVVKIKVRGTAFLRGMMRRIAGALYEIGRGARPETDIEKLLDAKQRDLVHWPVVLPAHGLTLKEVRYARDPKDHRENSTSKRKSLEEKREDDEQSNDDS